MDFPYVPTHMRSERDTSRLLGLLGFLFAAVVILGVTFATPLGERSTAIIEQSQMRATASPS